MDVEIRMPDLATTADEIRVVRWLVEAGQRVRLGEPLLEIETDKATMEVESIAAGTLKAIFAQPDDLVAVGQVIAIVEDPSRQAEPESPSVAVNAAAPLPTAAAPASPDKPQERRSMFARNQENRQPAAQPEIILTGAQREAARRLQESKQTIPHFYLNTSANAERIGAARAAAAQQTPVQKLLWDAFFVHAVARALQAYPKMAYRYEGERLRPPTTDAIGVAADIDDQLYVVAVETPLTQTPAQISRQIADQVERIRQGDPAAKRLRQTAITITNLGAENIESFQAIINPGEAAILAIGRVAPVVQAVENQVVIQTRVSLSLSVDHRIANGKYAAGFLSRIVKEIESS